MTFLRMATLCSLASIVSFLSGLYYLLKPTSYRTDEQTMVASITTIGGFVTLILIAIFCLILHFEKAKS